MTILTSPNFNHQHIIERFSHCGLLYCRIVVRCRGKYYPSTVFVDVSVEPLELHCCTVVQPFVSNCKLRLVVIGTLVEVAAFHIKRKQVKPSWRRAASRRWGAERRSFPQFPGFHPAILSTKFVQKGRTHFEPGSGRFLLCFVLLIFFLVGSCL